MSKELLANLEFSKVAFKDLSTSSYGTSQGDTVYYDIDPELHNKSLYGITVTDSDTDERLLKEYKEFSFNASQNGDLDIGFEAIGTENVSGIRKTIRKLIASTKEFKQKMEENAQVIEQEKLKSTSEALDKTLASNERIAVMNNNAKLETELIKSDIEIMKLESGDKNENGKDDETEMMIKQASLRLSERAQALSEQKHYESVGMNRHKMNIDKENLSIKKSKPNSTR